MDITVPVYLLTREQLLALGLTDAAINSLPSMNINQKSLQNVSEAISLRPNLIESGVKLNDLPDLPFEKILGYLSLEERLKLRPVSRKWRRTIDSFKVKNLCYSERQIGFVDATIGQLVTRGLDHTIRSYSFESFLNAFASTVLSKLKHFRLCYLRLDSQKATPFVQTINSLGQLEELDLFFFNDRYGPNLKVELNLSLPMLKSIRLEDLHGIKTLNLDAPELQFVEVVQCGSYLRVNIAHCKSVETLIVGQKGQVKVKKLKNLMKLYFGYHRAASDSTLISGLERLKEVHLVDYDDIAKLFKQKQQYDRTDLKVFYHGLLVDGPDDWPPMVVGSGSLSEDAFHHMAENCSRLADPIPLWDWIEYTSIERASTLESAINVVNRLSDLKRMTVWRPPVTDIEGFLNFLKKFSHIVELIFNDNQPQELFDRLPEHSTVQRLMIRCRISNLDFLSRFPNLIDLDLNGLEDVQFIRNLFEKLESLKRFKFLLFEDNLECKPGNRKSFTKFEIKIDHQKRFKIEFDYPEKVVKFTDLDAVVQFIAEKRAEEEDEEELFRRLESAF